MTFPIHKARSTSFNSIPIPNNRPILKLILTSTLGGTGLVMFFVFGSSPVTVTVMALTLLFMIGDNMLTKRMKRNYRSRVSDLAFAKLMTLAADVDEVDQDEWTAIEDWREELIDVLSRLKDLLR